MRRRCVHRGSSPCPQDEQGRPHVEEALWKGLGELERRRTIPIIPRGVLIVVAINFHPFVLRTREIALVNEFSALRGVDNGRGSGCDC